MSRDVVEHRLVIVDRSVRDNVRHRHRYQATCVCGWKAVSTRRRQETKSRYRMHVESKVTAHKHRNMTLQSALRAPTPVADLPDVLR